MSYKKDMGKTKHPALYVAFNECTSKTRAIPCRVGMAHCLANSSHPIELTAGHFTFPGTAPGASGAMAYFFDAHEQPYNSLHRRILAPSENIGKTIIMHAKLRVGAVSTYKHLIYFCAYSAGGIGLEVTAARGLRLFVRLGNSTSNETPSTAPAGTVPVDAEFQLIWSIKTTADQMQHRIYIVRPGEPLGAPVILRDYAGAPSQLIGPQVGFGYGPGYAFDIKDFLAVTVEDDAEAASVRDGILAWYKSPNNQYELPNFLRQPTPALARQRLPQKPTTCLSWHTLRDVAGNFSIAGMYAFTIRYVLQNSAFDGVNLTLAVAAFQPTAGHYLTAALSDFADWLHTYGLKLRITLIDQTYLTPSEIPDHMPCWRTRYGETGLIRKVVTYWDDESFDVDAEIFANPRWSVYDPARGLEGTYRWFHHCWTIVDCLKDKPAFHGISIGETSGSPWESYDTRAGQNVNGQHNTYGIYGITDANGVYQLDKCFSARKQRVALGKLMHMFTDQLKFRPDVAKAVQTNYFRAGVVGNNSVYYNQDSNVFNAMTNDVPPVPKTPMFKNGDAAFLVGPSSGATAIGLAANHLYYVINRSGNTFQLADHPDGPPLQFTGNITTPSCWLHPICNQIELNQDGFRTPTTHNGVALFGENREMRYLAEQLHQYGFAISGPDIFTTSLEMPYYYEGPYVDGKKDISPVEIRLAIRNGTGWFSDLGPLPAGASIQGQTSTYQDLTNAVLAQIGDLYGPKYMGRLSLAQAYRYAIDRLKCTHIDMYVDDTYPEKTFPGLVEAVVGYKLS